MKEQRLMRIRELVSQQEIETQEELVRALEDSGFAVTQATISRDIKELQLIKVVGTNGRYKYAIPVIASSVTLDTLRRKLADVFVSQARAQNLVVIKVLPGNAQAIGFMIDSMNQAGLLGTIAGDDTILLVCQDDDAAMRLLETLLQNDRKPVE
ncbi:arginine repressor [Alicyclobacillus fastidiosus]|uniref:Arginine repressor n=1 Tax=Alicyclobacillus fastidiosus TaxID=392011 RepID=A0ABV5ABG0_9BACL|nr:arginine repressor [Alicyclobacillus fastidiosus]WEH10425.1 arginine repressor [Alicyclobacillus fastidiosus]